LIVASRCFFLIGWTTGSARIASEVPWIFSSTSLICCVSVSLALSPRGLDGHTSLRAIAAELNRRGMMTRRGGRWQVSNVRNLVRRLATATSANPTRCTEREGDVN
jgi:hypothetical protein